MNNESTKTTIVVSAFPACGKSWMYGNSKKAILDSDSSNFSWVTNDAGEKVRNPEFPKNYIEHIKANIGKADIIFVSSHLQVRQALKDEGIKFVTVYPKRNLKEEWIGRCYCRGNDAAFLSFLNGSWESFMDSVLDEPFGDCIYRLDSCQHISDIIDDIEEDWLMRVASQNKNNDDAKAFELTETEIDALVSALTDSEKGSVEAYSIFKRTSRRLGERIYLNARKVLGPAASFYRKENCDFIVRDYDGTLIVWNGGHWDSINKFSQPYKDVFAKVAERVSTKLGKKLPADEFRVGFHIESKMLEVYVSIEF